MQYQAAERSLMFMNSELFKKIIMSFAQEGNSDIYTMDIKTRVVEKLTDHPSIDTSPSYSPDGSYITFNSDRSGFQQIYTMKSDGTNVKRISFGEGARVIAHIGTPANQILNSQEGVYFDDLVANDQFAEFLTLPLYEEF